MTEATAQGWRWVPEEPTQEIEDAIIEEIQRQGVAFDDFSEPLFPRALYRVILAAAPSAPVPSKDAVERVARAICCPDGECRAAKHDEGYKAGKYILPMPCDWRGYDTEARAALSASAPQGAPPACAYCGTTEGLRKAGERPPDYICEQCFTPQDDGPCFDDLEPVEGTQ